MPIPARHKAPFAAGAFYHIYNRSVNGTRLFASEENYRYFLQQFHCYLGAVWDVYAFCLLPNHFHFLVRVKEEVQAKGSEPSEGSEPLMLPNEITRRYKNFCLSYSHAYKKQMGIGTNVFSQHFKHILIDQDDYFTQLIFYIHLNTVHHSLQVDWQNYLWSSYRRILQKGTRPGAAATPYGRVLEWFGGPEQFIRYHQNQQLVYLCEFDV